MLKPIRDTEILKRYSQPPGDPPDDHNPSPSGGISVFPSSPLDLPLETFENALKRREKNHHALIQWIRQNLHPDVDYGRIHIVEQCQYAKAGVPHLCRNFSHMSMPTLLKAGAEKLLNILGLSAHFPNLHQYELAAVHKQEITQVLLKCELKTLNGKVVAEGSGARNIRQDNWNLNTSIKMAEKSALIDATIRVAGLTGIFIKTHRHTLTKMSGCNKNSVPAMSDCNHNNLTPGVSCQRPTSIDDKPMTQKQKDLILRIVGRKGLTTEGLKKQVNSQFNKDLNGLDRVQASKLIQHLNG